jgi:hypothetical protein
MKLLGIISVGFNITDQVLVRFVCIRQILKTKLKYNETVHQLFINFKTAYDSVRREVLNNILIEFGVPMKLVRLIEVCLNEMYSTFRIGKHLSDNFPIQNDLKQGDALSRLLFIFALEYGIRNVQENKVGLKIQLLLYADETESFGRYTAQKARETLTEASKEVTREVNTDREN